MCAALNKLSIRGFKSIRELDGFELRELNVLIGANGSGKSNFVDFFRMLRAMMDEGLQEFVNEQGGGSGFLHLGPKRTRRISSRLEFGDNAYDFELAATVDGGVQLTEREQYTGGDRMGGLNQISKGVRESVVPGRWKQMIRPGVKAGVSCYVYNAVSDWTVYHFHDTSRFAAMRLDHSARDDEKLRPDAANLATFLGRMRTEFPDTFAMILDTVRLVAPFISDFVLRPKGKPGKEKVRLEWRQKGSDFPFQPTQLSDGTIRFICLATALLQPKPPTTIVIDEPELGLHPDAISLLAEMVRSASTRMQVILSTQSAALVDCFEPQEIVAVNRDNGQSNFERLEPNTLTRWLEHYSVGELWQKNVIRAGPA